MYIKCFVASILLTASISVFSQQKEIRVQIKHNDEVAVDTTIKKSSDEAKIIIETLVQKYTTQNVSLDAKLTHGLYVFNIDDENWIEPPLAQKGSALIDEPRNVAPPDSQKTSNENSAENSDFDSMDIDSLFKEFSHELNEQWDETDVDIWLDSVGSSFQELWQEIKKADFQDTPEFKQLKSDFKDVFEKLKETRVIIIQDGDTLKID